MDRVTRDGLEFEWKELPRGGVGHGGHGGRRGRVLKLRSFWLAEIGWAEPLEGVAVGGVQASKTEWRFHFCVGEFLFLTAGRFHTALRVSAA